MKRGFFSLLTAMVFFSQTAFGAWTTIPKVSSKAESSSLSIFKKTKNVPVGELVKLSEPFFSPQEYEKILKQSQKVKNIKIDKIMHGKDFFYMKAGDLKIVFKWIDTENIAFKINGHAFSYEEAAKAELWQPKVLEVIKNYQSPRPKLNSMFILESLFAPKKAEAFLGGMLSNPLVIGAVSLAAVALIGNHFYKKHKQTHEANKDVLRTRLEAAKANLETAKANGETNLASYEKAIADIGGTLTEYNGTQNDVGFFGYLFGQRMRTPARYETVTGSPSSGAQ